MTEMVTYEFSYKIELTPLEADIRLEDIHPLSPLRDIYLTLGLGAVVFVSRKQNGKEMKTSTTDFLTKGARHRAAEASRRPAKSPIMDGGV
jgi:hypothetical protein